MNLSAVVGRLVDWIYRRASTRVTIARLRALGVSPGGQLRAYGLPLVTLHDGSVINIGKRVVLCSSSRHTALGVDHPVVIRTLAPGAVVEIGDDVGISGGAICAAYRVTIGAGSMLGANVTIADTDFHPVRHPNRRYAEMPAPRSCDAVTIGRNVFIGTGAIVLKGVAIGDNSVIGAGVVIAHDVPSGSVVRGGKPR